MCGASSTTCRKLLYVMAIISGCIRVHDHFGETIVAGTMMANDNINSGNDADDTDDGGGKPSPYENNPPKAPMSDQRRRRRCATKLTSRGSKTTKNSQKCKG